MSSLALEVQDSGAKVRGSARHRGRWTVKYTRSVARAVNAAASDIFDLQDDLALTEGYEVRLSIPFPERRCFQ